MPLTLEEQAELVPLSEKASDLIIELIMEENPDSKEDIEFHKIIERISLISPIMSNIYLDLYNRVPKIKSRLLDWVKNIY